MTDPSTIPARRRPLAAPAAPCHAETPGAPTARTQHPAPAAAPRRKRLPTVVVELPRCPHCHTSTRHKVTRTINQGDDTRKQWRTCLDCGGRFTAIIEPEEYSCDGSTR